MFDQFNVCIQKITRDGKRNYRVWIALVTANLIISLIMQKMSQTGNDSIFAAGKYVLSYQHTAPVVREFQP